MFIEISTAFKRCRSVEIDVLRACIAIDRTILCRRFRPGLRAKLLLAP
jgi:hypothetical protein